MPQNWKKRCNVITMEIIACIAVFYFSYLFGSFAFPQIIGSIKMLLKKNVTPYAFTLALWSIICISITALVCVYLIKYFVLYVFGLVIPFILTIRTKNIE